MKKKKIVLLSIAIVGVLLVVSGMSYALFTRNLTKDSNFKTVVGNLELSIENSNSNSIVLDNLLPTKDDVALTQDGYTFTITNTGSLDAFYTVYLEDYFPAGEMKGRIPDSMMKVNLSESTRPSFINTKLINELDNHKIGSGVLRAGDSITYNLRLWLDYDADNTAQGRYYASNIRLDSTQEKSIIYDSVEKALTQFKPSELKDAVMCSYGNGIYYDCEVYNTINEAIASRVDGIVVATSDIDQADAINILEEQNITLVLNGKKIKNVSTAGDVNTINNSGSLNIEDETKQGEILSNGTSSGLAIYNTGKLTIKDGVYGGINNTGELTILNGTFNNNIFSNNYSSGVVLIKGGVFLATVSGYEIDIMQTDTPIYMRDVDSIRTQAHISGNQADKCTENPQDTTSGLCVYYVKSSWTSWILEGDFIIDGGTFINKDNDGFILRTKSKTVINGGYFEVTNYRVIYHMGGELEINGGTFISNDAPIVNLNASNSSGFKITGGTFINNSETNATIDLYSAKILGGTFINKSGPALKYYYNLTGFCNATLNGNTYDIYNVNGNSFRYNNVTFSNGTTTPDPSKIYGSRVTEIDTCPITSE